MHTVIQRMFYIKQTYLSYRYQVCLYIYFYSVAGLSELSRFWSDLEVLVQHSDGDDGQKSKHVKPGVHQLLKQGRSCVMIT